MTSAQPFGQAACCYYTKATAESCFCLAVFRVCHQQLRLPDFSSCLVFHTLSDARDEPELQVCCCLCWVSAGTAALGGDSPRLFVDAVHVPQNAGVIHDHDERPHALALDSQFLQAVSFQF